LAILAIRENINLHKHINYLHKFHIGICIAHAIPGNWLFGCRYA
jgi:hypothetical protein